MAGLKTGRLPVALEGVAGTARRVSELRRSAGVALVYPLIVLSLTWILGLFVLIKIAPVTAHMLAEFQVTSEAVEIAVERLVATLPIWGTLVPLLFATYLGWAWYRSSHVSGDVELHPLLAFGAVRTLAGLNRACRSASLADLLGLMLAHNVPLPEAVELASAAVGSRSLAAGGKELAESLARGEPISRPPRGFPPLLAWLLASGHSQERLLKSLARTAEVYRAEISRRTQFLSIYTPLVLTIAVAGGFVFFYTLLTLGPWIAIMRRLSEPYGPFF
jgi:type IV pilus assembly protein PilC